MKTAILSLVLALLPVIVHAELWGSSKSGTYHLASCRYAKKIGKEYRLRFESALTARDAGYKPCEVCNPPRPATLRSASGKAPADRKAGPPSNADR